MGSRVSRTLRRIKESLGNPGPGQVVWSGAERLAGVLRRAGQHAIPGAVCAAPQMARIARPAQAVPESPQDPIVFGSRSRGEKVLATVEDTP